MDWKPTRENIIFVIKQDSHENDFSVRYRWNSRKLLKYMLIAMNISFRFYPIEAGEFAFE